MAWEHFLGWFSSSFMPFTTDQPNGTTVSQLIPAHDFCLDREKDRKFKEKEAVQYTEVS